MAKRVPSPRQMGKYPSDVGDEEWAFIAPYLTLNRLDGKHRAYALRDVFNAVRWLVRSGAPWRLLPNDLPPWPAVFQQTQRWRRAGCFEAVVHDLRVILRVQDGRAPDPTAAIVDSRTIQSTPESGARAAYDGAKRRKGSKVHAAVDTLGHLLALHVTPADAQDRAQVATIAAAVQDVTGDHVTVALRVPGIALVDDVAGSSSAVSPWAARFRRLARDYERLGDTLANLHYVAFACLMLARLLAPEATS